MIFWSIVTVKIAWEREDASFISVALVILLAIPLFKSWVHSAFEWTSSVLRPVTLMEPFLASVILRILVLLPVLRSRTALSSKSRMSSPYSSKNYTLTLNSLNSDYRLLFSISAKIKSNTLGTIPISLSGRPMVLPVPIVCVLPLPVWP